MLSRKHFDEHISIPHTRANHNLECLTRVFEASGRAQCKQKFPRDAMHTFGFLQTLLCESSNKEPLLHSTNMQKQMLFVQHSRNASNFLFDTQSTMQSVPVTQAGVRKLLVQKKSHTHVCASMNHCAYSKTHVYKRATRKAFLDHSLPLHMQGIQSPPFVLKSSCCTKITVLCHSPPRDTRHTSRCTALSPNA